MYIIVGLGNPGKEYAHTRHNVGFETIDILADRMGIEVEEKKHKGLCGKGILAGQKVILLKPQTYMNLSGESVRAAADFYKVDPEDILVIYDDGFVEKEAQAVTMGSKISLPIWEPRNFHGSRSALAISRRAWI